MRWQVDSDRPIYTQLLEQMQRAIASGGFAPGGKLPGVRELAAEAGVNPNTMQRALAQLEETGLLRTQRTSGRFVTSDTQRIGAVREEEAVALTRRWAEDMRALGCAKNEAERYFQAIWEDDNGNDFGI